MKEELGILGIAWEYDYDEEKTFCCCRAIPIGARQKGTG